MFACVSLFSLIMCACRLEDGIFVRRDWLSNPKNANLTVSFLKASFKGVLCVFVCLSHMCAVHRNFVVFSPCDCCLVLLFVCRRPFFRLRLLQMCTFYACV